MQVFAGAITVIYNIGKVESLVLSRVAVNEIFLGEIIAW